MREREGGETGGLQDCSAMCWVMGGSWEAHGRMRRQGVGSSAVVCCLQPAAVVDN